MFERARGRLRALGASARGGAPAAALVAVPVLVVVAVAAVIAARALAAGDGREVVLDGLVAPRGLAVLEDGSLLVAEGGGGRLLRLTPDREVRTVQDGIPATLDAGPGGHDPAGISAAIEVDGTYYYVVGEFRGERFRQVYRLERGGEPEPMVPHDPDAGVLDRSPLSNPYDLAPAPGGLYVSDSGLNAVLLVTHEGEVSRFFEVPTFEREGAERFREVEAVPTGVTVGPDGALYVATLTGFPFPRGGASVYRLADEDGDGRADGEGEATVYASGFTTATDVAFAPDGSLLVTEYSRDMEALATEHGGTHNAEREPGRLLRWRDGDVEVIADDLVSPTSLAVDGSRVYVSEEFAGRVVAFHLD